jgi:hypothetical protein
MGNVVPVGLRHPLQIHYVDFPKPDAAEQLISLMGQDTQLLTGDKRADARSQRTLALKGCYSMLKLVELSDTPCWFAPSTELIRAMHDTTLKVTDPDQIRLPVPGLALMLPRDTFVMIEDEDSDERSVTVGEKLVNRKEWYGGSSVGAVLLSEYVEPLETTSSYSGRVLLLMHILVRFYPTIGLGWTTASSALPLTKEALDHLGTDEAEQDRSSAVVRFRMLDRETDRHGQFYDALIQLCLNLVLYMTLPGADVIKKPPPPIKQIQKLGKRERARQFSRWESWIGGTRTRCYRISRGAPSQTGTGRSVSYSFIRKGSFVTQAYGPGRSLRRVQWRRPTIVRPDLPTKRMGHTYHDGEESKHDEAE